MDLSTAENPFYLLGLSPDCSAGEVEAQGEKLLLALKLGLVGASTYLTPAGIRERDAEMVGRAVAELLDADRRTVHEAWARLDPIPQDAEPGAGPDRLAPWRDAMELFGR